MDINAMVKRLERATRGARISIPQRDGSVATFSPEEVGDAYLNMMERHGSGEDAPPEHAYLEALRNSPEPAPLFFRPCVHADPAEWVAEVEDLSR